MQKTNLRNVQSLNALGNFSAWLHRSPARFKLLTSRASRRNLSLTLSEKMLSKPPTSELAGAKKPQALEQSHVACRRILRNRPDSFKVSITDPFTKVYRRVSMSLMSRIEQCNRVCFDWADAISLRGAFALARQYANSSHSRCTGPAIAHQAS